MVLYFLTGNKNKFFEVKKILSGIDLQQKEIDLVEIQETNSKKVIEHKLEEAKKHIKEEIIIEDTSLHFDCLNGLPGPLIKWFEKKLDLKVIYDLIKNFDNKTAFAKTIIAYSDGIENKFFEGIVEGKIVSPRGEKDFGWGPIFLPNGFDKTFGEMKKSEKNNISMRKIALEKFKEYYLNK
jgi:inosine triphosphate pyrophosphatase